MKDGIEVEKYVPSEMTLKYPNFLSSLSHASWVPFRLPSVLLTLKKLFFLSPYNEANIIYTLQSLTLNQWRLEWWS